MYKRIFKTTMSTKKNITDGGVLIAPNDDYYLINIFLKNIFNKKNLN